MWVEASAPSNIALIKYMGKMDPILNKPCNTSLSYTLNHLRTFVRIKPESSLKTDTWSALIKPDLRPIALSHKGQEKFLHFFTKLKKEFHINSYFNIESANNFPSDCGLASSASSFAALTKVTYDWSVLNNNQTKKSVQSLALISKQGSGSSCRSFYSPWAVWSDEDVKPIEFSISNLKHQVILCDESVKSISSSQAHSLVLTSDLFQGRPHRAESRYIELVQALKNNNWKSAFEICWNEFWDMHNLFHTAKPAFMYMNAGSQAVLQKILQMWQQSGDGPIVTMDAGSNIHLLYRPDQLIIYSEMIQIFNNDYAMWTDEGYHARK